MTLTPPITAKFFTSGGKHQLVQVELVAILKRNLEYRFQFDITLFLNKKVSN